MTVPRVLHQNETSCAIAIFLLSLGQILHSEQVEEPPPPPHSVPDAMKCQLLPESEVQGRLISEFKPCLIYSSANF